MDGSILSDKNRFPTEGVIFSHIGKSKVLWLSLFDYIHASHPDVAEEWRYYNDGKSWLLKVTRKKKTVFWLSLIGHSFRTTFYFGDAAEKAIRTSALSDDRKEQFRTGKKYGKIRGITVTVTKKKDIEDVKTLIKIKTA